jgi:Na+-transporting methylmalonyl-CoA/oxaloacetate decarboxylase gamma subunit
MAEGLTVIAAGLVVVLCIMLSMFVFIEVILKFDQILRNRAERAISSQETERAGASPAADPEASRNGDEVIAAIGLALQKHIAAGVVSRNAATSGGLGPTPWASSGRLGIMTERQRVTTRRS